MLPPVRMELGLFEFQSSTLFTKLTWHVLTRASFVHATLDALDDPVRNEKPGLFKDLKV